MFPELFKPAPPNGQLKGVVTLPDGTPLIGALVTLATPTDNETTTTDATGYAFTAEIGKPYHATAYKLNDDKTWYQADMDIPAFDPAVGVDLTMERTTIDFSF